MKIVTKALSIFGLVLCLAVPASAGGGSNNNANASAGAVAGAVATGGDSHAYAGGSRSMAGGSTSSIRQGNTYTVGGIGASACVDSFGTSILSLSLARHSCEVRDTAFAMFDRGLLSASEARSFGLLSMKMSGAVIVSSTTTSVTTMSAPTKPAAKPVAFPNINGDWNKLSHKQQKAIAGCDATWNDKKIQGCAY
jgi:hypothetical protein